jgi:hypothetical protein
LNRNCFVVSLGWQRGAAFIRGINIFGSKRISKKEMLSLCKKVEDKNLRIVRIFKTDNIVLRALVIAYSDPLNAPYKNPKVTLPAHAIRK